ncbi:MAG TPA: hypothetical protein VMH35_13095 [Streptosporangiaceae bacterium]|nr:hypothetical protein [Streptosporangiaceae bacterium]
MAILPEGSLRAMNRPGTVRFLRARRELSRDRDPDRPFRPGAGPDGSVTVQHGGLEPDAGSWFGHIVPGTGQRRICGLVRAGPRDYS